MHMTNLASLQAILWNILEEYGHEPGPIFKKLGLNPGFIHRPGKRFPVHKTDALWQEAARLIDDPCFGLKAGEVWHPSHLGTLGYAMLTSTTLRVALQRMIRFHRVVSDINFATLRDDNSSRCLVFALTDREGEPYAPVMEDAVLSLVTGVLRLNYRDFVPAQVMLRHEAPDCSARYKEFFRSEVLFGCDESSISIPFAIANRPLTGRDQELGEVSEDLMTRYLAGLGDTGLIPQVKRIIIENLPSGTATVEVVAREMSLSTRTLQRMLKREGTSFMQLLHATRTDIACQYVSDPQKDLSEVAFMLGFSELSTFSRSFKKWTGKSPLQFRKAA